jgi:hypothetical protein
MVLPKEKRQGNFEALPATLNVTTIASGGLARQFVPDVGFGLLYSKEKNNGRGRPFYIAPAALLSATVPGAAAPALPTDADH